MWDVESGGELVTLTGHTDSVWGVAFSPDGTLLATASTDRTATVWDVESRRPRHTLTGHTDWVLGVAFSPDGTLVATASPIGRPRCGTPSPANELVTLTGHTDSVWGVAFSPDGHGSPPPATIGRSRCGTSESGGRAGHPHRAHRLGVGGGVQSRRHDAGPASDDDTVRLWDPATGESIGKPPPVTPTRCFHGRHHRLRPTRRLPGRPQISSDNPSASVADEATSSTSGMASPPESSTSKVCGT